MIISGSDAEKYSEYKQHCLYSRFKCLQVLRLQLPHTMKFVTRLTYYFKLKSNGKFQCCQNFSKIEWLSLDHVKNRKIPNVWGPELSEFCNTNFNKTKIFEYSLEEAFLYVPRDPPRNLEEDMLKTIRITEKDVQRLYEDFLNHCFPSFYLTIESFKCYMKKRGFETRDVRLERFFHAFNYHKTGFLTFHEFLLGLACMEPAIQHGKFRVKFIFRFYSDDYVCINRTNLHQLLMDIDSNKGTIDQRLEMAMKSFKINDKEQIMERDFVSAIGAHKFRGTSVLCRYSKGIFTQISRCLADKGLSRIKKILSNVPMKRRYKESCITCREKKYDLATHSVTFDVNGNIRCKRINVGKDGEENRKKSLSIAQQYSIEIVFNRASAANIIINLVRDFVSRKGTVRKPNGLLQNNRDNLWKLLLAIYHEIDILLKNEKKCQKLASPCFIMGDIHGNIEDLFSLERTLWKQIPCVGANYLFLGDYVDRGQWGFECAMYLFAFKIICPNKVTLLRGNHEVRLLQSHYTYKRECMIKYGEIMGLKIWELTNRIFDKLPVCATVDDSIFCAHGGIPRTAQEVESIMKVKRELKDPERESPIAWEILWSDPCHMQQFLEIAELLHLNPAQLHGYIRNTKRGTAFLFNETGLNNFLRKNCLTHVVRAHEVPPLGYTFHFGNKCCTIFSCSHYCGNDNDCACIMADNQKLRIVHLDTVNNLSATD